jgi:hypothetical protein
MANVGGSDREAVEECERIDQQEEGLGSSVAVNQGLAKAEGLKQKIQAALQAPILLTYIPA